MVTRKNTAAAMLPRITRRQDFGICFPSVKLNDHEDRYGNIIIENSISWTIMDNNKLIRENRDEFKSMCAPNLILRKEDCKEEYETKSFTERIRIQPTIKLIQLDYGSGSNQWECTLLNGIWVKYENARLVVFSKHYGDDKFVNILTQEEVNKGFIENECVHYSCLGNSPSGERRQMILCGSDEYDWNTMIDKASDGFLTLNEGEKTYK